MPTPRAPIVLGPGAADRFWSKIDRSGDCWIWAGAKYPTGYGYFWTGIGRMVARAHRVAVFLARGPIPDDMEIDHLCRNRACVRPSHLEAVPHRVNVLRGRAPMAVQARRTHCKNGHEFSEDTIYVSPSRPHSRICRLCPNYLSKAARWSAIRRGRAQHAAA